MCVCVCIVYRSVTKGGRQLGLTRRECAAQAEEGEESQREYGESSCCPLWPKDVGGPAERMSVKKKVLSNLKIPF